MVLVGDSEAEPGSIPRAPEIWLRPQSTLAGCIPAGHASMFSQLVEPPAVGPNDQADPGAEAQR